MIYMNMRYEQDTSRVFTEIKISRVFDAIYPVTPARGAWYCAKVFRFRCRLDNCGMWYTGIHDDSRRVK